MNLSLPSSSTHQAATILPISPCSSFSSSSSIFPVSIHQSNHDESTASSTSFDYRKALKELATLFPQDQQKTHENLLSIFLEANSRNDLTVAEESLRFLAKLSYFQNTTSIAATALFCANILQMKREFLSTGNNIKTEENNLHTFSVLVCVNTTTSTLGNDDDFLNEIFSSIEEKQRSILRFANMLFQLEMKILKEMRSSEKDYCTSSSSFKLQLKIEEMESELLKIELESTHRQEQVENDDDKLLCFDAMKFWFRILKSCCECKQSTSCSTKLFSKNLMHLLTVTRKKDSDDDHEVKSNNNHFITSDLQLRAGLMLFDVDAMEHLMKACCPTKVLDKKLQNFGQKKNKTKNKKGEEEQQEREMTTDNISSSLSSSSSVLERALSLRVLRSQIATSLLLRKRDDRFSTSSTTSSSKEKTSRNESSSLMQKQELVSRLMNTLSLSDEHLNHQQQISTEEVSETFAFLGLVKLSKDIFDGKIRVSVQEEEKKKHETTTQQASIKLIKKFIEDEEAISTPEILWAIKSVLGKVTKTNSTFHIFLVRLARSLSNLLLSMSSSSSSSFLSSSFDKNYNDMLDFTLQSLFEERLQVREDFFNMMRLDGSELTFRIYEDEGVIEEKVEDFKNKIMKMKERTMKDDEEELDLFLNAVGVF